MEQRHAGSGTWFLESEPFKLWKENRASFLWLYGIPGCGKTILSSSVIEDLKYATKAATGALLYFYFDFNDVQKQSLDSALRSLVAQLSSMSENAFAQLHQLRESCNHSQPSTETLTLTFENMVDTFDQVRIVFDALDECNTRRELLQWIEDLMRSRAGYVQVIATSRKVPDIESALVQFVPADAIIPMQQSLVDEDIAAYVSARIRNDKGLQRWRERPEMQRKIESKLMEKADGMYVEDPTCLKRESKARIGFDGLPVSSMH